MLVFARVLFMIQILFIHVLSERNSTSESVDFVEVFYEKLFWELNPNMA
jgi:hypothetical protein